jgi:hypothetical protein
MRVHGSHGPQNHEDEPVAKEEGASATTSAKPSAAAISASKDALQAILDKSPIDQLTGKVSGASLPAAARATMAKYEKQDRAQKGDVNHVPGRPFAIQVPVKGQAPAFAVFQGTGGPLMVTLFDAKGHNLGEGEINSDEDNGINW